MSLTRQQVREVEVFDILASDVTIEGAGMDREREIERERERERVSERA